MAQAPRQCTLLAGLPALLAQLSLAVLALATLAYKRHRERPQRPTIIWSMDITKQMFSSSAGHVCGLIIAVVASTRGGRETSTCAWYFVAFTFDTTLGVGLAVLIHKLLVRAARARLAAVAADPVGTPRKRSWVASCIASCGDYGDPPSWQRWAVQMAEWVAATVIARTVCGIVVVGARRLLAGMARLLDDAFAGHPTAELFSVMLAGPLAMNLIQAWLQDAVLKMKRTAVDAADEGALLLAERGRSDAPQLEEVKPAPSRGRPAAVAAASRSGQVALASLPPEGISDRAGTSLS